MSEVRRSALIVDSDELSRARIARLLREHASVDRPAHLQTAQAAILMTTHVVFDLVVVAAELRDRSGLEVARHLQALRCRTRVVLVCDDGDFTDGPADAADGVDLSVARKRLEEELPIGLRPLLFREELPAPSRPAG